MSNKKPFLGGTEMIYNGFPQEKPFFRTPRGNTAEGVGKPYLAY